MLLPCSTRHARSTKLRMVPACSFAFMHALMLFLILSLLHSSLDDMQAASQVCVTQCPHKASALWQRDGAVGKGPGLFQCLWICLYISQWPCTSHQLWRSCQQHCPCKQACPGRQPCLSKQPCFRSCEQLHSSSCTKSELLSGEPDQGCSHYVTALRCYMKTCCCAYVVRHCVYCMRAVEETVACLSTCCDAQDMTMACQGTVQQGTSILS